MMTRSAQHTSSPWLRSRAPSARRCPTDRSTAATPTVQQTVLGTFPPELGQWGTQCALIHSGLRYMPLQPTDWLFGIPNDWSLAERMLRIGVRFAMLRAPVVDYYPSRLSSIDLRGAS